MPSFKLPRTWTNAIPEKFWRILELRMQAEITDYPNVAILRAKSLEGHPEGKIARIAVKHARSVTVYSLWHYEQAERIFIAVTPGDSGTKNWIQVQEKPKRRLPPVFHTPHTYKAAGYCKVAESAKLIQYWLWCVAKDGREAILPVAVEAGMDPVDMRMHFQRHAIGASKEQFFECNGVCNTDKLQATGPFEYILETGEVVVLHAVNGQILPGRWSAFLILGAADINAALQTIQRLALHYSPGTATILKTDAVKQIIPLQDVWGDALTPIENFKLVC